MHLRVGSQKGGKRRRTYVAIGASNAIAEEEGAGTCGEVLMEVSTVSDSGAGDLLEHDIVAQMARHIHRLDRILCAPLDGTQTAESSHSFVTRHKEIHPTRIQCRRSRAEWGTRLV